MVNRSETYFLACYEYFSVKLHQLKNKNKKHWCNLKIWCLLSCQLGKIYALALELLRRTSNRAKVPTIVLRYRFARAITPERLKLELLAGWQENKNNSPVCSTSFLHRRQKGWYKLHSAF